MNSILLVSHKAFLVMAKDFYHTCIMHSYLWNFDEGYLCDVSVKEVSKDTSEDGLVSHNQEGRSRSASTLILEPFQEWH